MFNLSENQSRIARLVALGYTNNEVAKELDITERAVKSSLHVIFDKLGVWNRVELSSRVLKDESPRVVEQSQHLIEAQRLAELQALQVLDSVSDALFDEITDHLVSFYQVPMALVGLMTAEKLWFKSSVGFEVSEVPRELTICHHTIRASSLNVIHDARDSQFACNPLVEHFGLKFYAAAPILTRDGYALGVVCIVDRKPRQFKEKQLSLLSTYARIASRQFELRQEMLRVKQSAVPIRKSRDDIGAISSQPDLIIGETA